MKGSRAAGLHDEDSLVDDSKFLRMATERALARAGYNVITADEGPKGIELAKKERPDVILLDMLLPGMTGPEVLKALKKDASTAAIPVIAFTGLSQRNATRLQKDPAGSWRNLRWIWKKGASLS